MGTSYEDILVQQCKNFNSPQFIMNECCWWWWFTSRENWGGLKISQQLHKRNKIDENYQFNSTFFLHKDQPNSARFMRFLFFKKLFSSILFRRLKKGLKIEHFLFLRKTFPLLKSCFFLFFGKTIYISKKVHNSSFFFSTKFNFWFLFFCRWVYGQL